MHAHTQRHTDTAADQNTVANNRTTLDDTNNLIAWCWVRHSPSCRVLGYTTAMPRARDSLHATIGCHADHSQSYYVHIVHSHMVRLTCSRPSSLSSAARGVPQSVRDQTHGAAAAASEWNIRHCRKSKYPLVFSDPLLPARHAAEWCDQALLHTPKNQQVEWAGRKE